jgi:hypothetical protein
MDDSILDIATHPVDLDKFTLFRVERVFFDPPESATAWCIEGYMNKHSAVLWRKRRMGQAMRAD